MSENKDQFLTYLGYGVGLWILYKLFLQGAAGDADILGAQPLKPVVRPPVPKGSMFPGGTMNAGRSSFTTNMSNKLTPWSIVPPPVAPIPPAPKLVASKTTPKGSAVKTKPTKGAKPAGKAKLSADWDPNKVTVETNDEKTLIQPGRR